MLDPEKAKEFLMTQMASVPAKLPESGKANGSMKTPSKMLGQNQVQDHLRSLNVHKCMGPDEIHLWVLRKLANKLLSYYQSF